MFLPSPSQPRIPLVYSFCYVFSSFVPLISCWIWHIVSFAHLLILELEIAVRGSVGIVLDVQAIESH